MDWTSSYGDKICVYNMHRPSLWLHTGSHLVVYPRSFRNGALARIKVIERKMYHAVGIFGQ
jgi:hypothetical protein